MISSRTMWLSCAVACTLVAMATSAGDEYLPPSKGYNYEPPKIPFPTDLNGNKQPTPGPFRPSPTPAYRPQPTPSRPQPTPSRPQPTPQRPNTYVPPPPTPTQQHDHHEHHDEHHHHEPGMPFDFAYQVNEDDNNYSHNAVSDGDITRGEYRVALPDGRTQVVKYTADWKNGFNAEVSYEGEAQYPNQQPAYRPGPSAAPGYSPGPSSAPGYSPGPSSAPGYSPGPSASPGQAYVPPSQGGGYQY